MTREMILTCFAFSLFVVCPRMAGMMYVISKNSSVSMLKTVLIGTLLSIPFLLLMVYVFGKFGVWGALVFCVLTDFAAAFTIKEISFTAGIETIVIALFVVLGVKVAPFISKLFLTINVNVK